MTVKTPMIITPDFDEKQKQQQSLFGGITIIVFDYNRNSKS